MSSEIDKEGQKCFIGTGPAAPAVGRRDQAWYQLSHGITDTKRPLQPLLNEFFFGVFLKHPAAMSYGTSGTSERNGVTGVPSRYDGRHACDRRARSAGFRNRCAERPK